MKLSDYIRHLFEKETRNTGPLFFGQLFETVM